MWFSFSSVALSGVEFDIPGLKSLLTYNALYLNSPCNSVTVKPPGNGTVHTSINTSCLRMFTCFNLISLLSGKTLSFYLRNVTLAFVFMFLWCFRCLSASDTRKMIRMYWSSDLWIRRWLTWERERERIMFGLDSSTVKRLRSSSRKLTHVHLLAPRRGALKVLDGFGC